MLSMNKSGDERGEGNKLWGKEVSVFLGSVAARGERSGLGLE